MDHLKKIGAGFLDSMGSNRNKAPPDDLMVSCKKQLTDLRDEIMVVKQQFSQYAHQVVEAAEASVTLSNSVGLFYSHANHPGRSESVNMYKKVQEDIANRAVKTFHITVENGLLSELSEWSSTISNLHEKIENAESTRTSAHDTQNRLIALQNEYQKEKEKKSKSSKGLFGRNAEQIDENLKDLQIRINEASDGQKSLSLEYQSARNSIAQNVKQLMEKRYRYFDRIYVQMLECQSEYFQNAAIQTKKFQRDIDYYRKQYPKTHTFQHSNGSDSKDFGDNGFANLTSSASPPLQPLSNGHSHSSPNKKPKPPTSAPPKLHTTNVLNESKKSETTNSSTPIVHSPLTPNPADNGTPTPTKNVFVQNIMTKPKHASRQLSTHDMINLNGPITPSKVNNNVGSLKKGDSMWNDMLGGDDNTSHTDHYGLADLAAAESNNLFDLTPTNPEPAQKSDGDIFDFMNASKKQHPKQNDSTHEWFANIHNPQSAKNDDFKSQNNGNSNSMHDDMMKSFNKPSYGGGHDGNNPKLNASETNKVPKNGATATAHINNKDMSSEDKKAMANMKLSKGGAQKAKEAYKKAMDERQREEELAKQRLKEIAYWKEKHEAKLNEWEYKDTVRRNIRTLIGKMPDVIPSELKWKPIPMTKLLDDAQLKKGYYKAVRVVHPDKSIGRGDSIENQVICDYVFQALEQAHNKQFG